MRAHRTSPARPRPPSAKERIWPAGKTLRAGQGGRCAALPCPARHTELLGDHSGREPPGPIPNPEVKPPSADDSAAACRAKVGNRQAPYPSPRPQALGFFFASGATSREHAGSKTTIHRYLKEIDEQEGENTGKRVAVSDSILDFSSRLAERLHEMAGLLTWLR